MTAPAGPVRQKSVPTRRPSPTRATAASGLDYPLIAILATLLALGLVEVYSASMGEVGSEYFLKQLLWVAVGVGLMIGMTLTPYRFWQRGAVPLLIVTLLLLVAVLFVGQELYGAKRTLFNGRVQPSEFAKLCVVIYVSAWVASKKKNLRDVRAGLIPFAIVMGIIAGLVVLEKSMSVTIILLVTGIAIFFLGGGDAKQLLVTGLIALVVLLLLTYYFHYGITRIEDWWKALMNPEDAPLKVAQVHEMIRRGGGIGTRPENWFQKNLVPLLWSDYLFANVVADLKVVGALAVVVLFAALGYRGLNIALNAPDQFGALAAIGVTTWLLTQAFIHMGTSVALIPATGVPLPFMSYGGSAMIVSMAGIGLLMNIGRASPEKKPAYARFSFGGWHRGPRVSNPRRGGGTRPKSKDQVPTKAKARRTYGFELPVRDRDDDDGPYDWRTRAGQSPAKRSRFKIGGSTRRR